MPDQDRDVQVLVVDDDERFRSGLVRMLTRAGYDCIETSSADEARAALAADGETLAVVLCDVRMPGESGLDLLRELVVDHPTLAVVMMTGGTDSATAELAIDIGADGYLVKPFDSHEVVIALATGVRRRSAELARREAHQELDRTIGRVRGVADTIERMEAGGVGVDEHDLIERLSRAVSLRHEETAQHLERMSRYSVVLAQAVGLSGAAAENLRLAAALHDVGKIGVPDSVLLKPGKLTPDEFAVIQKHASYGYQLLAGSASPLITEAAEIALGHHEWWDGTGYPLGLRGEEISERARIVAVTDVFDALTSDRVYRPRFSFDEAVAMMTDMRGRQFEARLFDAFIDSMDAIRAIAAEFPEQEAAEPRVRVLVVDDHEIFVDSLVRRLVIEDDLHVVAVASGVAEARAAAIEHEPDVVLMDFELPDGDGAEATEAIKNYLPTTKVVMLTGRTDQAALVRALTAGCSGFVTKVESVDRLIGAVRAAHAGEGVTSAEELSPLLASLRATQRGVGMTLSDREIEVLELMATGLTNQGIADRLYLSVHTVRNHVSRILEKLQVHSKLEAVAVGVREGVVAIPRA